MRPFCGLSAAFLLAASPCLAAQPDACLHYEAASGGSPVILAMVQDQGPLAFVLDTASSGTTLNDETVARLSLRRDVETEAAQGMGGPMDVSLYRVASLTAGPLALTDFTVPAIPAPALEGYEVVGLAGIDLFGDALATWNATPGCVRIGASGVRPEGARWSTVTVQWIRPWKIMLPVRIGTVEGWGLLDTGAQYTVLNRVFADRLGLTDASGRLKEGGEITGIDGRPMALSMTDVDDVAVGGWRWDRRTLRIGDLPVFSRLGEDTAPLAVIGIDWLGTEAFAIDYGAVAVWQRLAQSDSVDKPKP